MGSDGFDAIVKGSEKIGMVGDIDSGCYALFITTTILSPRLCFHGVVSVVHR